MSSKKPYLLWISWREERKRENSIWDTFFKLLFLWNESDQIVMVVLDTFNQQGWYSEFSFTWSSSFDCKHFVGALESLYDGQFASLTQTSW